MILGSMERIHDFTEKGWWGTETLNDLFQRNVANTPNALAVVDPPNRSEFASGQPQRLTYGELQQAVDRLATVLIQHGIKKDDIIAVQLPNIVELVVVYFAAARIGAIISPFPAQYREFELEQLVNFVEAKTFITITRIGKHQHASMVVELRPKLPTLTSILVFGDDVPVGTISLDERMNKNHNTPALTEYIQRNEVNANDVFTICWTSGTEGTPKGVPRNHNEWLVVGMAMMDAATLDSGCNILNPFPLVNMAGIGGMMMSWLLTGGKLVQHHPLSLPTFLQQISSETVNFTVAPPALLNMLLQNESLLANADISTIKTLGSGSSPLSPWMVKTWQEKYNISIVNFFGSNEGTTLISGPNEIPDPEQRAQYFPRFGDKDYEWPARISSRMQTKLVDLQTGDTITEPGKPGELLIKGAAVFAGYYQADHLTKKAFDPEDYYRTGDVFEIAAKQDGNLCYYHYVGRCKDIIIRGGFNISPEEIEMLIQGYPKIADVAVIGFPDEVLGECICACVVPRPGEQVTLEELVVFLRDKKIAAYKLPERLEILETLPRNAVGKVLKYELREQYK
ncbi:MAG: class I adenylate-forming enzyme family protein [Ktedonobacteraceae bacterium]